MELDTHSQWIVNYHLAMWSKEKEQLSSHTVSTFRNGTSGVIQHARGSAEVSVSVSFDTATFSSAQSFSFISNEINALFGVPFTVLMDTVNSFMPMYRKCNDVTQKKLLLLEFMCSISRWMIHVWISWFLIVIALWQMLARRFQR